MVLPDMPATIFEGEAEMALIIGKRASNVAAADAMSYIFGYTNFIDGSARGVPAFYQMKARETFAPIGPAIVTADEVPNPQNLQVKLWNNGTLMQNFNTDDMAHKIARCIEWVSSIHTLEPGDILATGTNHRGLNPFMDGDKIELETEGLGKLTINVKDDLKRTWDRKTLASRCRKRQQRPDSADRRQVRQVGPVPHPGERPPPRPLPAAAGEGAGRLPLPLGQRVGVRVRQRAGSFARRWRQRSVASGVDHV